MSGKVWHAQLVHSGFNIHQFDTKNIDSILYSLRNVVLVLHLIP